jgi:hypothetical protein
MDAQDVWELINVVNRRLDELAASGEIGEVFKSGDLAEARRLTELLEAGAANEDPAIRAVGEHLIGTMRWYQFQLLPSGEGQEAYTAALAWFRGPFLMGLDQIPDPLIPVLVQQAIAEALPLKEQAYGSREPAVVRTAAFMWRAIAAHTPADHPDRVAILANTGNALLLEYEVAGTPGNLDETIACAEKALSLDRDHPHRPRTLALLARALRLRMTLTTDGADLDRLIEVCDAGVAATSGDADHEEWLAAQKDAAFLRLAHDDADS